MRLERPLVWERRRSASRDAPPLATRAQKGSDLDDNPHRAGGEQDEPGREGVGAPHSEARGVRPAPSPARRRFPRWAIPIALALYAAFRLEPFLGDGLPIFFDAHSHLARTWMSVRALAGGSYPSWSFDWYGGFRLLQFYSPGYYLTAASLSAMVRDVVLGTKLLLWLGQVGSVVAFYAWARTLTRHPLLAVCAALLLLRSAERMIVIGLIGNYPSLFVYLCAPLLLWVVVRLGRPGAQPIRLFAAHGLILAVMVLGHLGNSIAILPALLAFELAWLHSTHTDGRTRNHFVIALLASVGAAAVLTAFATLPLWLHADRVGLSLSELAPRFDVGSLQTVLGIAPYSLDRPFARSDGALWWILAAAAAAASLHPRQHRWRPLAIGLLASLGCVLIFGERGALAPALFLFPLCMAALEWASSALAQRGVAPTLAPGLCVAALVILPTDRTIPPLTYEPADALSVYERVPETRRPSRTFDVTASRISLDGFYGWSSFSPYFSGRAIPFGAFPQGAPLSSNVSLALASTLASELRASQPVLSQDAADLLYLLHVEWLVDRGTPTLVERLQLGLPEPETLPRMRFAAELGALRDPQIFQLRHASPAIFAPRVQAPPAELTDPDTDSSERPPLLGALERRWRSDPLDHHADPVLDLLFRTGARRDGQLFAPLLRGLRLDRESATAERFYVAAPPAAGPAAGGPRARFRVIEHREEFDVVHVEAESSAAGYVRMSYAFDRDLRVSLDGRKVTALADALGTGLIIPFPAGTHHVTLRAPSAGPRSILLGLSCVAALCLAVLVAAPRFRGERGALPEQR